MIETATLTNPNRYLLLKNTYPNGSPKIQVLDEENLPLATLSLNINAEMLLEGEFAAKTWSENRFIIEYLQANEIIIPCNKTILADGSWCPVYKINNKEN